LKYGIALAFAGFAVWILIPDKEGEEKTNPRFGAFVTTVVSFFLAEMGDKTQLATIALAARYHNIILVTTGTTLGMLFSDGLAVFAGERITRVVSMKWIRYSASALYLAFALAILVGY